MTVENTKKISFFPPEQYIIFIETAKMSIPLFEVRDIFLDIVIDQILECIYMYFISFYFIFYFLLSMHARENIVLGINFRVKNFDGFSCFEIPKPQNHDFNNDFKVLLSSIYTRRKY